MALSQEDMDTIKQHLEEWIREIDLEEIIIEHYLGKPLAVYEAELRQREARARAALEER